MAISETIGNQSVRVYIRGVQVNRQLYKFYSKSMRQNKWTICCTFLKISSFDFELSFTSNSTRNR